jgi:ABC-type transport system involved in cytochrome c biogenesis permease subunit
MHIVAFLFVMHTITLIARWYISGHAPWSNAYEAIVCVAWATMFLFQIETNCRRQHL